MSNITIYHNPACGTSRNTLEMIRNSGTEPTIIYYLETPPTRDELVKLIADMGITVRALLRKNVEPYEELGLAEDKFTHDQLIDFMLQHPILINRPIGGDAAGNSPVPPFRSRAGNSARCAKRRVHQGRWRESG